MTDHTFPTTHAITAHIAASGYASGLHDAADLLIREAQKRSHLLAEIEDEDGDEAHLCAMEVEILERMAERILALQSAR